MFKYCVVTNGQKATFFFVLFQLCCCLLVLTAILTKLTWEADAQVRAVQEYQKAATALSIYFSFVCMVDFALILVCLITFGKAVWYSYRHVRSEK